MSDQHALGYYAAPGRETATQAGAVESWAIPADNMSGPIGSAFNSGAGTNAVDMAGLNSADPSVVANSGSGPIVPVSSVGAGVIPTI
jgi:hypothetical protein